MCVDARKNQVGRQRARNVDAHQFRDSRIPVSRCDDLLLASLHHAFGHPTATIQYEQARSTVGDVMKRRYL